MGADAKKMDPLLRWGLILLALGTGPLVAIIVAAELGLTRDPNPNPVGFGILTLFTFWPAVFMIAFGAARQRRRKWLDPERTGTE
jgi:hypothetical protein